MVHYIVRRNGRVVYAGPDWGDVVEALPPFHSREFGLTSIEEKDGDARFTYLSGVWIDNGDMKFEKKEEKTLPLRLTAN